MSDRQKVGCIGILAIIFILWLAAFLFLSAVSGLL